ncbi:MAG: alanine racemase [Bacilli bacterium]|nr:alanine racemase [Bacilli bacterium]
MYRKTYALIDCDILKENIKNIKDNYKYKYYIGVVKANAYGHGDYIVNSLIEGGINYLAASSLEECLNIRKRNKEIPILCLEKIDSDYLDICEKENITITITDMKCFKELDLNKNIKAHIKIDSGMNRLGFKDKNEVKEVYDNLKNSNIKLEGIYTHFGTSGMWDKHYDEAIEKFKEITSLIDLNTIPIVHLSRSLTLVTHPKIDFATGVRLGIVMYGFDQNMKEPEGLRLIKRNRYLKKYNISPISYTNNLKLKTAFSIHSTIMCTKYVKKGEYVGYGAKYTAKEDIKIAIIPIGFADGINKNSSNLTVKINNKEYPIIGEIGMDMITVKIDESIKTKDKVIIFDDVKKRAKELNLSAYCLLTSITNRVPRVYKEKEKYTEIKY